MKPKSNVVEMKGGIKRTFTRREMQILQAICDTPSASITEIARRVGISRQHASALLHKDPLRAAVAEAMNAITEEAMRKMKAALGSAVRVLTDTVENSAIKPPDRIRAARAIFNLAAGRRA